MDARGSAQLAGCLKALNTLHKAGRIALPASRRVGGAPTPQRFDAPVAAATAVPGTVEAVAGLSLERVEQGGQRRVWNTLLHFEHPQGTTTFAGWPGALSGGLGARGAGRGRVFGCGAAIAGARGVDGVEWRAASGASAPGAVPEPVPDPPRRALPQPGQPGAGPGAGASGGGFRSPLPVSSVAGGDLRRPRA